MLLPKFVPKRHDPPRALIRRARQWLAARERLVSAWITRAQLRARASMQSRIDARRHASADTVGRTGAIRLPYWWEYESPLKRRLALEAMLRRMFALVPEIASAP